MRTPHLTVYFIPRRIAWTWTLIAIAMMVPSYLGQIWIWFLLALISIPTVFTLKRKVEVNIQYKQIQERIIWIGIPLKTALINVKLFRGVKIEKVMTGDLNTSGMGSTHYYHSYRTFLEYNEEDVLKLESSLSEGQLEPTHQFAKSLQLEATTVE